MAAPHCDDHVLHAPSECVYCDREPAAQQARVAAGIPFSPNEANGWSGNVAVPAGKPHTHMGATYVPGVPGVPGVPVESPRSLSRRAQRLLAWLRR